MEERQNEECTQPTNSEGRTAEQEEEHDTETTTLLPNALARREEVLMGDISGKWENPWSKMPLSFCKGVIFCGMFFNGPLIGGIFKAWLTASVSNVGELFAALQLVVVGAKLSGSLLKMKKGEASGTIPLIPMFSIFFIRFIMWPADLEIIQSTENRAPKSGLR